MRQTETVVELHVVRIRRWKSFLRMQPVRPCDFTASGLNGISITAPR